MGLPREHALHPCRHCRPSSEVQLWIPIGGLRELLLCERRLPQLLSGGTALLLLPAQCHQHADQNRLPTDDSATLHCTTTTTIMWVQRRLCKQPSQLKQYRKVSEPPAWQQAPLNALPAKSSMSLSLKDCRMALSTKMHCNLNFSSPTRNLHRCAAQSLPPGVTQPARFGASLAAAR